jgi:hypothetical protein
MPACPTGIERDVAACSLTLLNTGEPCETTLDWPAAGATLRGPHAMHPASPTDGQRSALLRFETAYALCCAAA